MLHLHPTVNPARYVVPIPGVPEAQVRALDRRVKLHRQLLALPRVPRSDRDPISPEVIAPVGPILA